ncbi:MAG: hypothetical protein IPL46_28920 [Saprospiraceae bacterium]|nr:hypothetical protein [Saprospiraceae bacterium]
MENQFKIMTIAFCLCFTTLSFGQSVLFEGPASLPMPANPPASGKGNRMMWYPDKAAFRAGGVNSTEWDKDSIGNYSAAFGHNNIAGGIFSAAFGDDNRIAGYSSIAFGSGNRIFDGSGGEHSQIWGNSNFTDNGYTTAWGTNNIAHGSISTVFGRHNITRSYLETVLGQFNDTLTSNNPLPYVATDYLFVIGNGTAANNRSNALEVYKNGNTVIKGALTLTKELNIGGVLSIADSLKVQGPVSMCWVDWWLAVGRQC